MNSRGIVSHRNRVLSVIHNGALVAMMTYLKNGEREKERERESEKEDRYILVNIKRFKTFTSCTVHYILKMF